MSIFDQLQPPKTGDYPDWFKFHNPGDTIEGVITDMRIGKPSQPGEDSYPIMEIQRSDGTAHSVGCGAANLYRQVYEIRPAVGGMIRLTFTGYDGRVKLFQVDYQAPANGQAPAPAAPAPAQPVAQGPAPQAGFAPQGAPAQPWGQQPQPQAATPWGGQ